MMASSVANERVSLRKPRISGRSVRLRVEIMEVLWTSLASNPVSHSRRCLMSYSLILIRVPAGSTDEEIEHAVQAANDAATTESARARREGHERDKRGRG